MTIEEIEIKVRYLLEIDQINKESEFNKSITEWLDSISELCKTQTGRADHHAEMLIKYAERIDQLTEQCGTLVNHAKEQHALMIKLIRMVEKLSGEPIDIDKFMTVQR